MAIHEVDAIPFEPQDLRGERLLVLAPHPDDEVIGCGGLVALHLRERRVVHVVVATDGAEADASITDRDSYRARREEESRAALAILGEATIEFLRYPDRQLEHAADMTARLSEILRTFKPDLIAVPSPIEIHPDHFALARAFCELVQRDESLFADLAIARVAFYEVGLPIRPNALVDITAVAEVKYAAIAAHASQNAIRDYGSFARGLNAYRAMTLPPGVRFAEGYWVTPLPSLRTTPFSALRDGVGAPPRIEIGKETMPISVIVRTKDRPERLREAIDSIRATGYLAEIVVVNDGGVKPELDGVTLLEHDTSRGRAEAANAGVRAAKSAFIIFLDDDDLFYPEHLGTLADAASRFPDRAGWYSDAVSAFLRPGGGGTLDTRSRMRIFAHDFDRELLLVDNYIPLPTILFRRDAFLDLSGFDPQFDLFEDWDFLIRLAQRGEFLRVPRITCEIRHIEGSGSILLESPEGSERFRSAKRQVWNKHAALIDNEVFANVFEREKRRTIAIERELVDVKGVLSHADQNAARLERDKQLLIAQLQALSERINETMMRISHLEGANAELRCEVDRIEHVEEERNELLIRVAVLGDARAAYDESQQTIGALYAELARLQNLLDTIYKSRTWKLHEIVQRMKGRA